MQVWRTLWSLSPLYTDSLTRALIFLMRLTANPTHRHSGLSSIQGMLTILCTSMWQRLINKLQEPGADLRVHKGYKRHPSLRQHGLIKVKKKKKTTLLRAMLKKHKELADNNSGEADRVEC